MSRIFTVDFTRPFIHELAGIIEREYISRGRGLGRLAVVFGGRRPALFLKKELARRMGRAFIPPRFFTINEFMDNVANTAGVLAPANDLEDCFEIYRLARTMTPGLLEGRATFAKFQPWAADILDLIGQLDIEDVADAVVENVQQSARIGYEVPEGINHLLAEVLCLRRAFHARLEEKKTASRGLQYLRASRSVAAWDASAYDEIIFANFFYFHRTEEAVVKDLHARGKATLVFQGDQRKWPVLERIARRFGCELKEGPVPVPVKFDLKVYSTADVHAEAATVRDILAGISDKGRTVVVLPDPAALVPFLSALPDEAGELNVSMGYPLRRSSLFLLLEALFKALASRRGDRYYAKDYLALIQHPFVKGLAWAGDPAPMAAAAHAIEDVLKGRVTGDISGRAFVTLEEIEKEPHVAAAAQEVLATAHAALLGVWDGMGGLPDFARKMRQLLDVLAEKSPMNDYPLNVNILARMRAVCDEFGAPSWGGEDFTVEEAFRIFEGRAGTQMVHFSGTPLKGLQVLGLEETRSLDFEHVIVMDVNEGILPDINVRASLIPREVMVQLNLDRLELEEEIQHYQFMRVISSAASVHLVYQKNREKEPGRFVEELVWNVQQAKGRLEPYPTRRGAFAVRVVPQLRQAGKTPAMMAFLKNFTFSATSINAYMANPYTFYTTYVLGLRGEEDLLDEPDAVLVGTFMHGFLEELYKPWEGKSLDMGDPFEKRFWAIFERRFREVFLQRMRSDAFLVRGVMEHKLRAFLAHERERAPSIARVEGLERDLDGAIPLSAGPVRFKVRIDRIEEGTGGGLLVLDYKTGGADKLPKKALSLSAAPDRREIFDSIRSFQLPLYMYFIARMFPGKHVNAGLYSLRDTDISLLLEQACAPEDAAAYFQPFLHALDVLVGEVLDPGQPFIDDELRKFEF